MRTSQVERERVYTRAANDDIRWLKNLINATRVKAKRSPEDRIKIYDDFYRHLHRMGFYKVEPKPVSKNDAK